MFDALARPCPLCGDVYTEITAVVVDDGCDFCLTDCGCMVIPSKWRAVAPHEFVDAYIRCMLLSTQCSCGAPGESRDSCGCALDEHFDADDLDEDAANAVREDCDQFWAYAVPDGPEAGMTVRGLLAACAAAYDYTVDEAGIDFWLTRNDHGAGFWDRGFGTAGGMLTDIAQMFGSVCPFPYRDSAEDAVSEDWHLSARIGF